ncbi:hypothetical protein B0H14DRAFT_2578338 [Mycena olivaceomarginata]|nr:hypothetical protein B0H14DRAFT_2578338 [Mycena olivaceomarginata]
MSGHNDSDEETYFAGGERSGISVQDPGGRGGGLVRDLLRAHEEGASGGEGRLTAGHTLGGEGSPSAYVPGAREEVEGHPFIPLLRNSCHIARYSSSAAPSASREEPGCQYKHERGMISVVRAEDQGQPPSRNQATGFWRNLKVVGNADSSFICNRRNVSVSVGATWDRTWVESYLGQNMDRKLLGTGHGSKALQNLVLRGKWLNWCTENRMSTERNTKELGA